MEKLLSVIIPTYNMEVLLPQCIDSVVLVDEAIRESMQVIVVNDGSKDASSVVAHEYEKKYPDVVCVIDKENGNYGSCINAALPIVRGKYVKVLDADDSFETENIPSFLNVLDNYNVDMVLTECVHVDCDGHFVGQYSYKEKYPNDTAFKFSTIVSQSRYGRDIQMHCITYNAKVFDTIDYHQTEGISYTDYEWTFYPMEKVNEVYFHSSVIYKYLVDRDGQTMTPVVFQKKINERNRILIRSIEKFELIQMDESHMDYFSDKISFQLHLLYYGAIIQGIYSEDLLSVFDKQLKSLSPYFYNLVSHWTLYPTSKYEYVKGWRMGLISYIVRNRSFRALSDACDEGLVKSKMISMLVNKLNAIACALRAH